MSRTRLSLFYAVTYLTISGVGFTFFPGLSLRLLLSSGHYDFLFVRVTGIFLLGLSALVAQIVRYRVSHLYPTLIGVRIFFCAAYVAFYMQTSDPMFLVFLCIVGLGLVTSLVSYRLDRQER